MTATLTLSCSEGIVLAADRRITLVDGYGNISGFKDNVDKIFKFSALPIGASYWGLASFGSDTMLDRLAAFEKKQVTCNDNVDTVSEKLEKYLESFDPKIENSMGVHLAGFCRSGDDVYPQLRHVFHVSWHRNGEFTNENSNQEYYEPDGTKRSFKYDPFVALFNGDNAISNAFFKFLPVVYPSRRRQIILDLLSLDEGVRFAKLVINTSGGVLDFLFTLDQKKVIPGVRGLMVAKITDKSGFEWVEK